MAKPLHKMSLDALHEMRDAVISSGAGEDRKMTMGELTRQSHGKVTMRAERAAVLAQIDQAIASQNATGSEKLQ